MLTTILIMYKNPIFLQQRYLYTREKDDFTFLFIHTYYLHLYDEHKREQSGQKVKYLFTSRKYDKNSWGKILKFANINLQK